jgi:hypothetical protein
VNFNCIINGDLFNKTTLQTKKGIAITGIILVAITAASFTVWLVPHNTQTKFVVSNAQEELDALIEQQKTISDSTSEEFDKMLAGQITPDEYINAAEISSSQINSFIIKIIEGEVPQEWQSSYSLYTEFLRAYNSYLRETMVIANKVKENPQADISQEMTALDEYLKKAGEYLAISNDARPA